MAGYIGTQAVSVNTTSATISDDLSVGDDLTVTDDAAIGGTLGVTGVVTANAGVVVDNFTLDGTTLALSSGDFTVDVAGDIRLNADGGQIHFEDAGVAYGLVQNSSSDFLIEARVQDKDILFAGNDGGSGITALTLDMSDGGAALFSSHVRLGDNKTASFGAGNDLEITSNGTNGTINAPNGDLVLQSAGDDVNIIAADNVEITVQGSETAIFATGNAGVTLYFNGASKFATTNTGVTVTGNLVVAAGNGIDFSAQTAASGITPTSELLDHYEEGAFTGTIFGGSTAGTYEVAAAGCHYTRIGNVVTCMFNIVLASSITAGGSGNMHFAGFPFPYDASLNTGDTNMCNVQGVDFNTNAIQLSLVRQSGSDTNVFVIAETLHNATQGVVQAGEFAANDTIRSTLTYFTLT